MAAAGLGDVRVVSAAPVALTDTTLAPLVPGVSFYSVTIRAFKLPPGVAEPSPEDYGQTAKYDGSLEGATDELVFDAFYTFPKGVAVPVDGNTAAVLRASRFGATFTLTDPGRRSGAWRDPQAPRRAGTRPCPRSWRAPFRLRQQPRA
eukprot:TRINITY_DN1583_c0_g1_i11.p1 TRINITY_DN1583_c0_g1~~TRINITY_DN1583_c0_g1_i11.p1  ORF type:complete len:162 (+),score=33.84 TRINITY_DN1583_c0_g1_i11:45-488(+)